MKLKSGEAEARVKISVEGGVAIADGCGRTYIEAIAVAVSCCLPMITCGSGSHEVQILARALEDVCGAGCEEEKFIEAAREYLEGVEVRKAKAIGKREQRE